MQSRRVKATTTEAQKRQEKLRRKRWEKAEKPYFRCCLKCSLSCSMTIQHGAYSYDIFNCPRENRGEPTFPYKWAEMCKEREKIDERFDTNGKKGQSQHKPL